MMMGATFAGIKISPSQICTKRNDTTKIDPPRAWGRMERFFSGGLVESMGDYQRSAFRPSCIYYSHAWCPL